MFVFMSSKISRVVLWHQTWRVDMRWKNIYPLALCRFFPVLIYFWSTKWLSSSILELIIPVRVFGFSVVLTWCRQWLCMSLPHQICLLVNLTLIFFFCLFFFIFFRKSTRCPCQKFRWLRRSFSTTYFDFAEDALFLFLFLDFFFILTCNLYDLQYLFSFFVSFFDFIVLSPIDWSVWRSAHGSRQYTLSSSNVSSKRRMDWLVGFSFFFFYEVEKYILVLFCCVLFCCVLLTPLVSCFVFVFFLLMLISFFCFLFS